MAVRCTFLIQRVQTLGDLGNERGEKERNDFFVQQRRCHTRLSVGDGGIRAFNSSFN